MNSARADAEAEPRLRCRVKDLVASCFNTCRLPLEEEEEESKPQPETVAGSVDVRGNDEATRKRRSLNEREPRFAEEDYIVFCFGEDGEIHIINSDTSPSSQTQPINNTAKMKNEVESSKMESSFESCDSSLSDSSTTSFAFPLLGVEWIGSPLHMPNAQKCHTHTCRF